MIPSVYASGGDGSVGASNRDRHRIGRLDKGNLIAHVCLVELSSEGSRIPLKLNDTNSGWYEYVCTLTERINKVR